MTALGKITEKDWQQQVEDLATMFSWLRYHTRRSKGSVYGFPDLVLLRAGRMVVAELKVGNGKLTSAQSLWLSEFSKVRAAEVFIWRPEDIDTVAKVLR